MARAPRRAPSKAKTAAPKKKSAPKRAGMIETYEGRDVVDTTIQVTNAGDGLSQALQVEPHVMHHGETIYLVLECEVAKVSYPPVKDTDLLSRLHTLKAGRATIVDKDLVLDAINDQHVRIVAARDAQSGQGTLGLDAASAHRGEHMLGNHASGLVDGCPTCEEERDLEAVGK